MGGTPGESRGWVSFLHATDLRQVPFILAYGLFSGIGRAPLAIGDEKGEGYARQIVVRQLRKGWEIVVLVFDIPAAWAKEAEEPAGIGFDVRPSLSPPMLPPPLLEELDMILPQGPGIARAFREWHREGKLVWLPPAHLDHSATVKVNETLAEAGLLPEPILVALKGTLLNGPKGRPSE
jgi:hypothetical protein